MLMLAFVVCFSLPAPFGVQDMPAPSCTPQALSFAIRVLCSKIFHLFQNPSARKTVTAFFFLLTSCFIAEGANSIVFHEDLGVS